MDPLFFVTDTEIREFIVPESRLRTIDTLEINPSIFDKEGPDKKKQRISDGYKKSNKRRSRKRRSSKCKSTKHKSTKRRSNKHRSNKHRSNKHRSNKHRSSN